MNIIETSNLSKYFGEIRAIENLNFKVAENEIFGIIGPDGAGKSTLFRVLCTLLMPDSGTAKIKNLNLADDYKKIRQIIGYMPGNFSLYLDLSVKENLVFFANIYNQNLKTNYHLIEPIYRALKPFEHRKARDLSGGMKQKLALCATLIHKPQILFLDEPTTGVDALSRVEFWEILKELKRNINIIVSTPYMDEASKCDRIALMNKGRFFAIDTPQNICCNFPHELYAIARDSRFDFSQKLAQIPFIRSFYLFGQHYHATLNNAKLADLQTIFPNAKRIEPCIEDCFMEFASGAK